MSFMLKNLLGAADLPSLLTSEGATELKADGIRLCPNLKAAAANSLVTLESNESRY